MDWRRQCGDEGRAGQPPDPQEQCLARRLGLHRRVLPSLVRGGEHEGPGVGADLADPGRLGAVQGRITEILWGYEVCKFSPSPQQRKGRVKH